MLAVGRVRVPRGEFELSFVRSSGPGGQNVNKVNSKAQLRWAVARSPSLPEDVRERFLARYAGRLTAEGELIVSSQRFRDQARNVADCLEKVAALVEAVLDAPKPRIKRRPSRAAKARRLEAKRRDAAKKEGRRGDWGRE